MIAPLLSEKPSELKVKFIDDYSNMFDIDKNRAYEYIKTGERFKYLTDLWYERLATGDINSAYEVYNDDYYFTDIWNCFVGYSRTYLRRLYNQSIDDNSIVDLTSDAKIILDIGCGIGYSTACLTQIYPNAHVYGLNIRGTKQWQFCESVSKKYNFTMIDSIDQIGNNVDVLFASEFFEHIIDPREYITDLVTKISPRYMLIANAFNTRSIGHFDVYIDRGQNVGADKMSKIFNSSLRSLGYQKIKTTLFNNKPNVWKKNDQSELSDLYSL